MNRYYYSNTIATFLKSKPDEILGEMVANNTFTLEQSQRDAWTEEITILQKSLSNNKGSIYLEYSIPRMGKRIDAVLIIGPVIFVVEFKIGEKEFTSAATDQVWDYALDLKNFHESSHEKYVAPVLLATKAKSDPVVIAETLHNDKLLLPIKCNVKMLERIIFDVLKYVDGAAAVDAKQWEKGRYHPTPTIVEAAMALYNGHSVGEISRSDASAINLSDTSAAISKIIHVAEKNSKKAICFVTGVPGAGKTLVGLNIAHIHTDKDNELYSVFLSGNGPLVAILREALARDKVKNEKLRNVRIKKGEAMSAVKEFIQNVHNFRDSCLDDLKPPIEHVALFDEAQRAWNLEMTADFMRRKRNKPNFKYSEPEFLISCLDRHKDWAVIVCLVGGGQEINRGEAGISEWIGSLNRSFPDWNIYISSRLIDSEYGAGKILEKIKFRKNVIKIDELHLSVSLRSFRAENVSLLVKQLLDLDVKEARLTLAKVKRQYPIIITRDLSKAKTWLKKQARGTERYGIVVSSQAERLRPHAIYVKSPMDPIHWFLDGKEDVRSSYYLEDVATEFHIQGLELDWACITWDADFRFDRNGWEHWSFRGSRWNKINKAERKGYLKNAYRVLLTRARQGMAIVVPMGDKDDPTRKSEYYDSTFDYLKSIGFTII